MSGRAKEAKAMRAPASAQREPSFQHEARGAELQRAIEMIRRGTAPAEEMCRALRLAADAGETSVLRRVKEIAGELAQKTKAAGEYAYPEQEGELAILEEAARVLGNAENDDKAVEILCNMMSTGLLKNRPGLREQVTIALGRVKDNKGFAADFIEAMFVFTGENEGLTAEIVRTLFVINTRNAMFRIARWCAPKQKRREIVVEVIKSFASDPAHCERVKMFVEEFLEYYNRNGQRDGFHLFYTLREYGGYEVLLDRLQYGTRDERERVFGWLKKGNDPLDCMTAERLCSIAQRDCDSDFPNMAYVIATHMGRQGDPKAIATLCELAKKEETANKTVAAHGLRESTWNDEVAEAVALLLEDENPDVQKTVASRGMKRHAKVDAAIRRTLEKGVIGTQLTLLDFMLEKDLLHFKETLKKVLKAGSTRLRMEAMEKIGGMTVPGFEKEIAARLASEEKVEDYEIKSRHDDKVERAEVEEKQIAKNALASLAHERPQEAVDAVKKRYLAEKNAERKEVFFEVLVEMHKIHEHVLWSKREAELEAKMPNAIEKVKWRVPLKEIRELHPDIAQAIAVLRKTKKDIARYENCIEQQKREMESLKKRIAESTTLQTPEHEELMKRMAEINANLALQAERLAECEAEHARASRSHHFGHLAKWWLVSQELKPIKRKKPWGYETFEIINERKSLTRLYMNAMEEGEQRPSTSFHFHARKDVTIVAASGRIKVVYDHDRKEVILEPGRKSAIDLPPATPHQIINIGDEEAQVLEFEAPCDNLFHVVKRQQTLMDKQRALASKDDICRLEDQYGRKGEGYSTS